MNTSLKYYKQPGLLLAAFALLLGAEVSAHPMTLGITSNLDVVELYFKELALLQKEEKWKIYEIVTIFRADNKELSRIIKSKRITSY